MQTFFQKLALGLLRGYKWLLSPLLPPSCRFVPTCSEYAQESIAYYGVWRGTAKAASRILRCHPFSRGGFDPVVKDYLAATNTTSAETISKTSPRHHS